MEKDPNTFCNGKKDKYIPIWFSLFSFVAILLMLVVSYFMGIRYEGAAFLLITIVLPLLIAFSALGILFLFNREFPRITYNGGAFYRRGMLFGFKGCTKINDVIKIEHTNHRYYLLTDDKRSRSTDLVKKAPLFVMASPEGRKFLERYFPSDRIPPLYPEEMSRTR